MLYHVAPSSAVAEILKNGLRPLIKQGYRRTEAEAAEIFVTRWSERCGRSPDEMSDLYDTALAAVNHVYAFRSLEAARKWAAEDLAEMVIFEIDAEAAANFRKDPENAHGEAGAMYFPFGEVLPENLKIVE